LHRAHQPLNLLDRHARVQVLGACNTAVVNVVTHIGSRSVLKQLQATVIVPVQWFDKPTVRLKQNGRAEKVLAVPPVLRAAGGTGRAKDTLVQPFETVTVGAVHLLLQIPAVESVGTERRSFRHEVKRRFRVVLGRVN